MARTRAEEQAVSKEAESPETVETADTGTAKQETADTGAAGTETTENPEAVKQERTDLEELESAVESILFASGEPVRLDRICLALDLDRPLAERVLRRLKDYYAYERRGIRLLEMEDSWQLCSSPDYADAIRRAFEIRKPARLSQPALEVLTIFAYYQPTTRAYVDKLRGVDSSYTVSLLLERKLIEPCGRLQVPGRPHLYRTTKQFLRAFHLTSLDDLPPLPEGGERLRPEEQAAILAAEGADDALLTTQPPENAESAEPAKGTDSAEPAQDADSVSTPPPEDAEKVPADGAEEGDGHDSTVDTGDSGIPVPPAVPDAGADSGGAAGRTPDADFGDRPVSSAGVPSAGEETGEEAEKE
ncbi:MAG: SMC-Scp complex subunit ScpB [Oscillibacter sp.]|nr:SMC-Scp complex subunit ScpB [Oscillibacter sp.]